MELTNMEKLFIAQCLLSRAKRKSRDLQRTAMKWPQSPYLDTMRQDVGECTRLAALFQAEGIR